MTNTIVTQFHFLLQQWGGVYTPHALCICCFKQSARQPEARSCHCYTYYTGAQTLTTCPHSRHCLNQPYTRGVLQPVTSSNPTSTHFCCTSPALHPVICLIWSLSSLLAPSLVCVQVKGRTVLFGNSSSSKDELLAVAEASTASTAVWKAKRQMKKAEAAAKREGSGQQQQRRAAV